MIKAWLHENGEGRNGHAAAVRSLLRFTAIAVAAAAIIIAIGKARRTDDAIRTVAPSATTSDPLAADLARCRDVTDDQLAADDTCRRIWAENRRRFFAPNNKPAEAH
jgi:conjugative transfer region protein TrbK